MTARREELGRKVRFGKGRKPGCRYTSSSYAKAVRAACERAGIEPWHPHQLRHTAATRITREYGVELARIVLGHRHISTTQLYAEEDRFKAGRVMAAIG
jgi:integrase